MRFCNGSPPRLVSLTVLNINGAGCLKASVDGNTKNIINVLVGFFYQFDLCVKKTCVILNKTLVSRNKPNSNVSIN